MFKNKYQMRWVHNEVTKKDVVVILGIITPLAGMPIIVGTSAKPEEGACAFYRLKTPEDPRNIYMAGECIAALSNEQSVILSEQGFIFLVDRSFQLLRQG